MTLPLTAAELPDASASHLPRWRGFNLQEKFQVASRRPFREEDFRLISEWGFNFVRLPLDYRCWIVNGDWEKFDESQLKEIDQAVAFGRKYNIHVSLNFHRAPGYTVARPAEKTDLWTDAETQRVCALHWGTFAKRYKGILSKNLSFNLFNEPSGTDPKVYAKVAGIMVAAIRQEDPDRLIIADGAEWGARPCPELVPLKIAQATRGYSPMNLTHYQASWINGSDQWLEPQWPQLTDLGGHLYGPAKSDLGSPLVIEADTDQPVTLKIKVMEVSTSARLVASVDGKEIQTYEFKCGPDPGPWKKAVYKPEWKVYQNLYDQFYDFKIPAGQHQITLEVTEGDWLTFNELVAQADGGPAVSFRTMPQWGQPNHPIGLSYTTQTKTFQSRQSNGRQWLWENNVQPWQKFAQTYKTSVMVGEWGAYNKTPHDVVIRWMEDNLNNFQRANFGWALWEFRGSFGILDSGRQDVQYEDFQGHKLDRAMLDLLRKY